MLSQPSLTPRQRYWRLIGLMAMLGVVGTLGAIGYLLAQGVPLRFHVVFSLGLGIMASLILAGVLMGLVFFSSRGGYDEAASNPEDHER